MTTPARYSIETRNLCLWYGKFQALDDFSGDKRTCQKALDSHNARRRRRDEERRQLGQDVRRRAAASAGTGSDSGGSPASKSAAAARSRSHASAGTQPGVSVSGQPSGQPSGQHTPSAPAMALLDSVPALAPPHGGSSSLLPLSHEQDSSRSDQPRPSAIPSQPATSPLGSACQQAGSPPLSSVVSPPLAAVQQQLGQLPLGSALPWGAQQQQAYSSPPALVPQPPSVPLNGAAQPLAGLHAHAQPAQVAGLPGASCGLPTSNGYGWIPQGRAAQAAAAPLAQAAPLAPAALAPAPAAGCATVLLAPQPLPCTSMAGHMVPQVRRACPARLGDAWALLLCSRPACQCTLLNAALPWPTAHLLAGRGPAGAALPFAGRPHGSQRPAG